MAKKFPNLWKETDVQVKKAQRVPNKLRPKRSTSGHIIIKMAKVKEKILRRQEKSKESHIRELP